MSNFSNGIMSTNKKIWIVATVCAYLLGMSLPVFAQPCPLADNPILGPDEVCPGTQAQYTITNDNSTTSTYMWTLSGGGQIIGPASGTSINIQWQDFNGGPFLVEYTERDISTGCTYPNSLQVSVADDIARRPFNCFSELSIPFDENCEKIILPEHLLTYGAPDCANSFEVKLFIDDDIPIANPVGIEHLGQVISAHVIHPPSGRTCISKVLLKDGTPPELFCENDTTICSDPRAWNPFDTSFKEPLAVDNCSGVVPVEPEGYEWIQLIDDPIFDALIIRTWSAEDKYRNRTTCQDTIFLRRVIFNMILCPPDTIISCNRQNLSPSNSLYFSPDDPLTSGVPTFMGLPLWSERSYCDFSIKYEDKYSYKCAGTYTIHRFWYLSQITPGIIFEDTCHQVIEIVDTVGPTYKFTSPNVVLEFHNDVYGLPTDKAYNTIHFPTLDDDCLAYGYFPSPMVYDDCTNPDSVIVDLIWQNGHINYVNGSPEADHLRFENLAKGKHIVTIKFRDQCHNTTYDTLIIIAEDKEAPYLVVDQEPVVTLNNTGDITWIDVSVFDEGTWDNCGLELLLARRVDWWYNKVDLCDDIAYKCGYEHDSVYCAYLETDKHINEVESHYNDVMQWLKEDGGSCGDLIYNAWRYDLCKKATFECMPYTNDKRDHFKELFNDIYECSDDFEFDAHHPGTVDQWDQIGGGWSKEVPFFCTDACEGEKVTIEIIALDAYCNYSRIWVDVVVEDKSVPDIQYYLPDLDVSCWAYNTYYRDSVENGNFNVFGKYQPFKIDPYAETSDRKTIIYDRKCDEYTSEEEYFQLTTDTILNGLVYENCDLIISETQKVHFERCGIGWIERRFVFKAGCNTSHADSTVAYQRINIFNDCPLQEHEIIWPVKDTTVYACGYSVIQTQQPQLKHYDECREIGIHYNDQIVDVLYNADSTCLKIIRTWAVIDWCRQNAPYHEDWVGNQNYHYYEYEQIIYIKNTVAPLIENCEFDTICIGSSCTADLHHTVDVSDDCTAPDEIMVSWILYQSTEYGYLPLDQGESTSADVLGLSMGSYKLVWKAEDACHNITYCSNPFDVVDCIKPTPVCLSYTTLKLLPIDLNLDGQVDTAIGEIWAHDLDVSSSDNCLLDIDFRMRIQGTGALDRNGQLLPPEPEAKSLTFGCDDVGQQKVEMWVVDQSGNADYCLVYVDIVPPEIGCKGTLGKVKGTISSLKGAGISDAFILLQNEDETRQILTDKNGQYDFAPYQMDGTTYTLWPEKYDNPIDGITTFDVLRISKHLLLKDPFRDPFELIAADVNGDNDVSVRDIISLRKLILGKIDTLPVASTWKFLNSEMQSQSSISLGFDYKPLLNFTGVKIGDVNGDVTNYSSTARSLQVSKSLKYSDRSFSREDDFTLEIMATDDLDLEGMQLEIRFDQDKIEITDIESPLLDFTDVNWQINGNHLYISWTAEVPFNTRGKTLFSVSFHARTDGTVSSSIALSKSRLSPELYLNDSIYVAKLVPVLDTNGIELYPNVPNPFREFTDVQLDLEKETSVHVRVLDMNGISFLEWEGDYKKGSHIFSINRSQLGSSGLYLFEVITSDKHLVQKMILLE